LIINASCTVGARTNRLAGSMTCSSRETNLAVEVALVVAGLLMIVLGVRRIR
jgi:hypothetical protein